MKLRQRFGKRSAGQHPASMGALLPWYLNDGLTPPEREAVEAWLRREPGAQADLAAWAEIQSGLAGQPQDVPSPLVWQRVTVQVRRTTTRRGAAPLFRLAWGVAVALAVLMALWMILQPGIVLQWSAQGGSPAVFRVYRAPLGSADFGLLGEVPAEAGMGDYRYVDARPSLGQVYAYRVEAVAADGHLLVGQAITAGGLQAMPGQAAVLFLSLLAGGCAALLAGRGRPLGTAARVLVI